MKNTSKSARGGEKVEKITGVPVKPRKNAKGSDKKYEWDKLTNQQKKFIIYYIEGGLTNAAQAAKKAGYADYTQEGYDQKNNPKVKYFIDKKLKEHGTLNELTVEKLMSELRGIINGGIEEFMDVKDGRIDYHDWEKIPDGLLKSVKTVKADQYGNLTYTFYDKMEAVEKLIKIYNLDNLGKKVKLDLPKLDSPENAMKYIAEVGNYVSDGTITIEQGSQLCGVARDYIKAIEVSDIDEQLNELRGLIEGKQINQTPRFEG